MAKTTKSELNQILTSYVEERKEKKKFLVLCHGMEHRKKFPYALLLDKYVDVKPDIVLDVWSKKDMNMFPSDFFDVIIMEHCGILRAFADRKNIIELFPHIYQNCKKTIKKSGEIRIDYLISLYYFWKYQTKNDDESWIDTDDEENYEYQSDSKKQKIISEVLISLKKIGFPNSEYDEGLKNKDMIKIKL